MGVEKKRVLCYNNRRGTVIVPDSYAARVFQRAGETVLYDSQNHENKSARIIILR